MRLGVHHGRVHEVRAQVEAEDASHREDTEGLSEVQIAILGQGEDEDDG